MGGIKSGILYIMWVLGVWSLTSPAFFISLSWNGKCLLECLRSEEELCLYRDLNVVT